MIFFQIPNNITIQGWRGRAHISCIKPLFAVFKHSQDMTVKLTLANLVLRNHSLAFRFSTFNVFITNCTFMNSQVAFAKQASHSPVSRMQSSSLIISDSEFLNNTVSVLVVMFQGEFTLNISRCVFQGRVDGVRLNGTSSNTTGSAAVYINVIGGKSRNTTAKAVGFITDSVFRELGHENNGFALSFLSNGNIFTNGTLRIFNTTFLHNKNESVFVVLNKGVFTLNISRCIFQGKMGWFNGSSWDKKTMAAVYVKLVNQSRESTVQAVCHITDSVFRELGHENNGFALSFLSNGAISTNGTLRIFNTTFLHNKNAVLVTGGLDAQLENVKIDSTNGNAIRVNNLFTVSSTRSSSLVISNSEFSNNSESVFVVLHKGVFTLNISRCIFQGKIGRFNGTSWDKTTMAAVYVKLVNQSRESTVQAVGHITDSVFRELGHENNGFALSFRAYNCLSTAGNLILYNTTFLRNENAISVTCGFDVRLSKVKVHSTYGYAFMANGPQKRKETDADLRVFLELCIFWNNNIGVRMAANICLNDVLFCMASSQSLVVKDSFFIGGNETRGMGDAIRFQVYSDHLYRPPFIKGELILENVTFQELHNSALYVRMQKNVIGQVFVKDCKFVNNSALIERLSEQPTVKIEFDEEDPPKCFNNDKLVWKNRSQIRVIFQDSVIEDNVGISGVLNFLNGNVSLINCTFKNNEGLTMAGHIYMKTGFGILHIVNSTFLQTRLNRFSDTKQRGIGSSNGCFVVTDSTGPLTISNSSFTANVNINFHPFLKASTSSLIKIDGASYLRCPPRRRVKLDKVQQNFTEGLDFTEGNKTCWIRLNYFKESCEECPDRFYSLQRGLATGMNISKGTECLECPYGATCEHGNVKAKENFWGMNISSSFPKMQFFPCPLGYCDSPSDSGDYVYNACHGNRSGVLCGKCSDGYSETLYSPLCRKKEKCNDHWFWLATTIYVVFLALYLVFKPPIFSELYRHSLWFTRRTERFDVQQLRPYNDQNHDPGYLKIIFYFYQVVELVMVNSPETTLTMVPIIPSVIAIFNFQVKTLNGRIGCPFPGLTAVTKALFQCTKFLGTLLSIGFVYVIHRAASTSRYISVPSLSLYLAVALETLLLGYERLADTSLKLMHCVPIDKDWRLFVDGNMQCWQSWQFLMIAFIVAFIVPLILVLFWGSLLLAKDQLTAKEFLLACAFPLPRLVTWTIRHLRRRDSEREVCSRSDTDEIKKVLYGPFRESSSGDNSTLYWESVLTGRRLLLLIIHTFATDPIIRFVCLNCACVLILVHHLAMRPFRDRKANVCEGLSLLSLVVICSFSLAEATYISEGMDPAEKNQNLFRVLQWIEIVLIGLLPAAASILVIFATLSQVVRLLYQCIGCLLRVIPCRCLIMQLWMPRRLLRNWDQENTELIV